MKGGATTKYTNDTNGEGGLGRGGSFENGIAGVCVGVTALLMAWAATTVSTPKALYSSA